jgi:tetratricopeptide (TPR) repeat protein
VAGDNAATRELAARAAGIGRRTGDADLAALTLQVQGRALVGLGRVGEAMAAFDEAMVAVVAGELSPVVVGTVYCSLLEACQQILEWRRAREWTEALTAWCGRQPDMVTYPGRCLVHRAELLHLHGAWQEAVEEARRAGERLARAPDSFPTGAACYQQAEVHRVLGELAEAEDAYRQASRWGHEPQPGLALLRRSAAWSRRPVTGCGCCSGWAAGRSGTRRRRRWSWTRPAACSRGSAPRPTSSGSRSWPGPTPSPGRTG